MGSAPKHGKKSMKEWLCVCSSAKSECASGAGQLSDICSVCVCRNSLTEETQGIENQRNGVSYLAEERGTVMKVILHFGEEAGMSRALRRALLWGSLWDFPADPSHSSHARPCWLSSPSAKAFSWSHLARPCCWKAARILVLVI